MEKSYGKYANELLAQASRHPHGTVSVTWGHISTRRKGRFGRRELAAANKLVKAGKLEFVHSDGGSPLYKHRYGINGRAYTTTYRLKRA